MSQTILKFDNNYINLHSFLQEHPTVRNANALHQICAPLRDIGIIYFSHAHIDEDQQMTTIGLQPDFFKLYFEKGYHQYDLHMLKPFQGEKYIVWDAIERTSHSHNLHMDFSRFNQDHTFSIIRSDGLTMDCYHFATHPLNDSMNAKYYHLLDKLKLFINYFNEQLRKHKELREAYKFSIQIDRQQGGYLTNQDASNVLKQDQIALVADKFYYNHRQCLSQREIECLQWLSLGKTACETAIILGITERTVKAHISKIKQKFNCHNLFQLGMLYKNLLASV